MAELGRPSAFDDPETLKKLEGAFLLGCSDREACLVADISCQTLYNYQKAHPDFVERKALLKENPVYKARKTVLEALESDGDLALKFLERRKKDEFSLRQETTGKDGKDLPTPILAYVVPSDHGDEKDNGDVQTPSGSAGGDEREQDGLDIA